MAKFGLKFCLLNPASLDMAMDMAIKAEDKLK